MEAGKQTLSFSEERNKGAGSHAVLDEKRFHL